MRFPHLCAAFPAHFYIVMRYCRRYYRVPLTSSAVLSCVYAAPASSFRKIPFPLYGFGNPRAPNFPRQNLAFINGKSSRPAQRRFLIALTGRMDMLRWALIFFVVALLAAVLGFTGIALAAAGIAKILFYVFVILFALSLLTHVARRP